MCRNIKTLFNFEPPATDQEIQSAAIQYVRKISGFTKPSQVNENTFSVAVKEILETSRNLLKSLETSAAPKIRAVKAEKARERNLKRFGNR